MINWKIRFKNPVFIAQFILAILTPILAYTGLSATDITSWAILCKLIVDALMNPYVVALIASSLWGCINDPTTKGISDSERALGYKEVG